MGTFAAGGVGAIAGERKGTARQSALWGRRGRLLAAAGVLFAAALVAPANALADAYVPPPLLERAEQQPDSRLHVIVVAERGYDAGDLERVLRDRRLGRLGDVRTAFDVIPALAVRLTGRELVALARRPGVRSITPDGALVETRRSSSAPGGAAPPQIWRETIDVAGLNAIAGRRAPAIAIVDSGVYDRHPAFGGRISARKHLSSYGSAGPWQDELGHGTLVAGIAAGAGEYPGVSPASKIVSLRVLGRDGQSVASDLIAAADWLYRNGRAENVRVANFSIVSVTPDLGLIDPINLAVEQLWRRGIVVVVAAGNYGAQDMLYAPASSPFAITVGAVDTNGTAAAADDFEAPWSSYGHTGEGFAKPELVAPGRMMVGPAARDSLYARLFPERLVGSGYLWMSGTSFSAPVVAGAAAQILARNPSWTPDEVKGALMATARPLPLATSGAVGVGEIDPVAAAMLADPPNGNAHLAPFAVRDRHGTAFDADAWAAVAGADPDWAAASWASASWSHASWSHASWSHASWSSASWSSASWSSASWASASWSSASWSSASWAKSAEIE